MTFPDAQQATFLAALSAGELKAALHGGDKIDVPSSDPCRVSEAPSTPVANPPITWKRTFSSPDELNTSRNLPASTAYKSRPRHGMAYIEQGLVRDGLTAYGSSPAEDLSDGVSSQHASVTVTDLVHRLTRDTGALRRNSSHAAEPSKREQPAWGTSAARTRSTAPGSRQQQSWDTGTARPATLTSATPVHKLPAAHSRGSQRIPAADTAVRTDLHLQTDPPPTNSR